MTDLLANLPPAVASVRCGGAHHQIVWRDGALHLPAHPDPEGELALAALGGEPCRCVELLGFWSRVVEDPRALIIGPRSREPAHPPGDPAPQRTAPVPRGVPAPGVGRPGPSLQGRLTGGNRASTTSVTASTTSVTLSGGRAAGRVGRPEEPEEDPLLAILELGHGLGRRLVATVVANLIERDDPTQTVALQAALYGRVLAELGLWLDAIPELDLELIGPDAERRLVREDSGRLRAELPLKWLLDVWAPELATVGERFTLDATHNTAGEWELLTVDADFKDPARTIVLR